jgi:hypothetical protein
MSSKLVFFSCNSNDRYMIKVWPLCWQIHEILHDWVISYNIVLLVVSSHSQVPFHVYKQKKKRKDHIKYHYKTHFTPWIVLSKEFRYITFSFLILRWQYNYIIYIESLQIMLFLFQLIFITLVCSFDFLQPSPHFSTYVPVYLSLFDSIHDIVTLLARCWVHWHKQKKKTLVPWQ